MTTPNRAKCHKAIKLLQEYERLMRKHGQRLPPDRLKKLNDLRDAGKITSNDLPAKLRSEFPGEFAGLTLDEIRKRCGMVKP